MTSTFNRPPLGALSTNILNRSNTESIKTTLPKLSSSINSRVSGKPYCIQKSTTTSSLAPTTNAEKLKYRLQLAYYKLRTNQVAIPVSEIIKKECYKPAKFTRPATYSATASFVISKPSAKKPNVTPSLTRHISLLAASTPLHGGNKSSTKKKVTFQKNMHTSPPKAIFMTNVNFATSLSKIPERPSQFRSLSSPNLGQQAQTQRRSLKIDDLCNTTGNTTTNDNDDETINETSTDSTILEHSTHTVTPVKRKLDGNGDLIMSSPTKKLYSSTPGSYGAAKSLLQLSLISSN